jgi:hypothetical protein
MLETVQITKSLCLQQMKSTVKIMDMKTTVKIMKKKAMVTIMKKKTTYMKLEQTSKATEFLRLPRLMPEFQLVKKLQLIP